MSKDLIASYLILIVFTLFLISSFHYVSASQNIIYVPDDYPTIQDAVNSANSGDKIVVRAGVYHESVVLNKSIYIVGEDPSTTIVDGNRTSTIFNVTVDDVSIQNFTIRNSGDYGIDLKTRGITIKNNIFIYNRIGVYMHSSASNIEIHHNTFSHGTYGVYMTGHNIRLVNNTISYNSLGFYVVRANSVTVIGNTFIKDGMYVAESYNNTVENNSVNGKPLVYLEDIVGEFVEEAGQVILVNCQSIIVKGVNISNTASAIELYNSFNITIKNSTLTDNCQGVYSSSSNNNTIAGNIFKDNTDGIFLYSSQDNEIYLNIFDHNTHNLYISRSSSNFIHDNNITNGRYGFSFFESSGNKIFHNNVIGNYVQVNNIAGSSNSTNIWDNGYPSGGNYWSDYNGTDADGDGIGDSPYVIDENNQDNYPLVNSIPSIPEFSTNPIIVIILLTTVIYLVWRRYRS